jgi:hypothetical protein
MFGHPITVAECGHYPISHLIPLLTRVVAWLDPIGPSSLIVSISNIKVFHGELGHSIRYFIYPLGGDLVVDHRRM